MDEFTWVAANEYLISQCINDNLLHMNFFNNPNTSVGLSVLCAW
jgi:hypothetical protein